MNKDFNKRSIIPSIPHVEGFEGYEGSEGPLEDMPTFTPTLPAMPPEIIKEVISVADSPEEADTLFLGAVTVFSSCLPGIYGVYAGKTVYANLYLFVTALASAGKGCVNLCRYLVDPIHEEMRSLRSEMTPFRSLFLPANSSATAFIQALNENHAAGLVFESEGDSLSTALKSSSGHFSDVLRKAYHHETISYSRRKNREVVEMESPRLSVLLAGTPKQVSRLMPNSEDGLFSRFMFYKMNSQLEWKDVFQNTDDTLENRFKKLGDSFYELYGKLSGTHCKVVLTVEQQHKFNDFFDEAQKDYAAKFGSTIVATVRRMGLILFRMCMVLSTLRIRETGAAIMDTLVCKDEDFEIALHVSKTLLKHSAAVFMTLKDIEADFGPAEDPIGQRELLFQHLPQSFTTTEAMNIASACGISDKSCERYLTQWVKEGVTKRIARGKYIKNEDPVKVSV